MVALTNLVMTYLGPHVSSILVGTQKEIYHYTAAAFGIAGYSLEQTESPFKEVVGGVKRYLHEAHLKLSPAVPR